MMLHPLKKKVLGWLSLLFDPDYPSPQGHHGGPLTNRIDGDFKLIGTRVWGSGINET
jgi:hypothetical protein